MKTPTKRQIEYWEKSLADHNLGMERGRGGKNPAGERWLVCAGDSTNLQGIEEQLIGKKFGRRVRPKGAGPD